MRCDYFEAGVCRSCTRIETAYDVQLHTKATHVANALAPVAPGVGWLDPIASPQSGFRNKAKLVVAGTIDSPTLGILDPVGRGVDLRECQLHEPAIREVLSQLADFVTQTRLLPYDVPRRRGELKYLLVTAAPSGELMLRLVLRSTHQLPRVRVALPQLLAALPQLAVVSANIHPEHKAVLEGEQELGLTDVQSLALAVNDVTLLLRPRSFFQTNTHIAAALYRQARDWVDQADPTSVLDLYCGIGGFALHAAGAGRSVDGIELSVEAIDSARHSASELRRMRPGLGPVRFHAGDATAYAAGHGLAELVIVNPPRRGLDAALCARIDADPGLRHVVYSSCNVDTLARDLARMPSLSAREARLFDMFPHTDHHEVMVRLERA